MDEKDDLQIENAKINEIDQLSCILEAILNLSDRMTDLESRIEQFNNKSSHKV